MSAQSFDEVCQRPYSEQAVFFLNAYWAEHGEQESEQIFKWWQKFVQLDKAKGTNGFELDEFLSHKFLETLGDTMTVIKMRETLKEIDQNNNKHMSLIEYLVWKFKINIKELLSRPQGTNEDLAKAQQSLKAVQAEIQRIEDKKAQLEQASQGTGVKAMQAKNELEQLLTKDNTDLNRAMITAEAQVRKAQKSSSVAAQGSLWWIDRELTEAKKYKPKKNLDNKFENKQ